MRPLVVGHRGAPTVAPENTLASLQAALAAGADAVEFDLWPTADGELVLMHDATLERTCGVRGRVEELTREARQALRAGGEPVPTLEDVLAAISAPLWIELKSPQCLAPFGAALERHPALAMRSVVISFHPELLRDLKDMYPLLRTGVLYHEPPADPIGLAREVGADALCPLWTLVEEELVVKAHAERLWVSVWTVDDPETAARLGALGVDAITTDVPGELAAAGARP